MPLSLAPTWIVTPSQPPRLADELPRNLLLMADNSISRSFLYVVAASSRAKALSSSLRLV
jgi:hypothetical protein